MNKLLLLAPLLAACAGSTQKSALAPAAPRPCESAVVRSDAELDRLVRCTTVAGDLDVSGVSSLARLENLRSVEGTLAIHGTRRLYSLSGLESLRRVGTLRIEHNEGLIYAGSLNALTRASQVRIAANPRLTSTQGFMNSLERASVQISIAGNAGLQAERGALASGADAF